MWWDEILVPLNAATPFGDILLRARTDDFHPPAFYLLIKLVLAAGDSDFALRLLSVAAGTAAVPLLYFLGAPRLGRQASLFAAACLAVNGPMLVLSRQVRPYALILFFSLLAAHCLLRWSERPRAGIMAGAIAATWGYVPLHYLSVLILAVQGLFTTAAAWRNRASRPWKQFAAYAAGSAAALGSAWIFFHSNPNSLTRGSLAGTALLCLDRLAGLLFGDGSSLVARIAFLALALVGTALIARRDGWLAGLTLGTVVGPAIVLSLARYDSYFNIWHLSFALPFLCLMAGACLDALVRPARLAPALAVGLCLAGAAFILAFHQERYYAPESHTGSYKQQARELPQLLRSGALLASSDLSEIDGVDWYASRYGVPDPLRRRPVAMGAAVALDFVSFRHNYGHLAKNSSEFLAHFDSHDGDSAFADGGVVHHVGVRRVPVRLGPTLPWRAFFSMTPWDVARQSVGIAGVSPDVYFGGRLVPELGGVPGTIDYEVLCQENTPRPMFVRLTVPFGNPRPGNIVRLDYAYDNAPPTVAFESRGGEPEAVRTIILRPDKPFSRLRLHVLMDPRVSGSTMTGNSGGLVNLKGITLYANALVDETLGSTSLIVAEDGVGPLESEEGGRKWRWALGQETTLRFTLPSEQTVIADLALCNPIAGQEATILFNGRPIEEIRNLPADKWLVAGLSRQWRLAGRQGENTLTIRFAAWNGKADAPGASFAPGDGRPLAAAFTQLRLEREHPGNILVY